MDLVGTKLSESLASHGKERQAHHGHHEALPARPGKGWALPFCLGSAEMSRSLSLQPEKRYVHNLRPLGASSWQPQGNRRTSLTYAQSVSCVLSTDGISIGGTWVAQSKGELP